MDESGYSVGNVKFSKRLRIILEKNWPSIYKLINSLFFGIINFFKFLIAGLWPGK